MKLGVRAKLFLISFGLIAVSVVVAYTYLRGALEEALIANVRTDLDLRARLVAREANGRSALPNDMSAWQELARDLGQRADARVSLIRKDGLVMGDSEVSAARLPTVENHKDRPEVKLALEGKTGVSVRQSATVGRRMMYVAEPFERDGEIAGVARVSVPLTRVDAAVGHLQRIAGIGALLALGVALVLSSVAAQFASQEARSLTEAARRMARGDLAARTRRRGGDELGELGQALDQLAEGLTTTLAELRIERDRLSGILSGMEEGVLLLDREGRVVLVNPALREMLIMPPDAKGKTPLEVIRHADLKALLDEAMESHQVATREIDLGGLKPRRLLVRAAPLRGDQGGTFAVFVDVTEMRRLETMRRDFVANVSHELRTPVTAIRSAAETLQTAVDRDPEAARAFVEMVARNAERLRVLIEDLLDLSRIESQKYNLAMERVDVRTTTRQVLAWFQSRAEEKQIALSNDVPEDLPHPYADSKALEHVLTNLVDNAIKYCPAGARVVVDAQIRGALVQVRVVDNGPGIEARHLPRLFERFYRVDAGRSRELGGTGLGLSIVRHLVEAMGGTAEVESELGNGTTFAFTLRTDTPPAVARSTPEEAPEPVEAGARS